MDKLKREQLFIYSKTAIGCLPNHQQTWTTARNEENLVELTLLDNFLPLTDSWQLYTVQYEHSYSDNNRQYGTFPHERDISEWFRPFPSCEDDF